MFHAIPLILAALFVFAVWFSSRRDGQPAARAARSTVIAAVAVAVWMTVTWQVAASGALRNWEGTPPPLMLLVVAVVLAAIRIAFSPSGRRIARHVPLWALVGVQAFRYPLEMAMHALADRGVMPRQMTYDGLNFDIVTGISAVLVAGLLATGRAGWKVALAWNVLGLALLLNIIVVAILSTPLVRFFGDDRVNVFVTYTPFVWLPAVMVLAALAGHLLIFRAIMEESRGAAVPSARRPRPR